MNPKTEIMRSEVGGRSIALLFLVSIFVLSISKIEDPDAWQHLSMGRLIWDLGGLPEYEPFVYTATDKPFYYSSWLFGFIYYLAFLIFDIYGVTLLKAVTVTAAFYILLRDALRPHKNHIVSVLVMIVVALVSRHRFVERPDTLLMIFLPFSIFSINAYVYEDKKYIYILPLVHTIWANSHSSINLMAVPFISFIVGGFLQHYLCIKANVKFDHAPSVSQLKIIVVMFILSFAASLISPYSLTQYVASTHFLAPGWHKLKILELQTPVWKTDKWPYMITLVLALSFAVNFLTAYYYSLRDEVKEYPSLIYPLMSVPFVMLAFTARRFTFLLAIVAGPILIRNISAFLSSMNLTEYVIKKGSYLLTGIWIVVFAVLGIFNVEPFADKDRKHGFGIDYSFVPEGALKYMDQRGITGRVFNLFHWGSYIIWRDFPKRSVSIDSRGYVDADLLQKMDLALGNPPILYELERVYRFESVLVGYPAVILESPFDNAFANQQWALVYWDDLSLLYLKRGGRYNHIIEEDEYKFVKPANAISRSRLSDEAYTVNLVRELKRNIKETGSLRSRSLLKDVYAQLKLQE